MQSPEHFSRRQFVQEAAFAATGLALMRLLSSPITTRAAQGTRVMPRTPGRFQLQMRSCRKPAPDGFAYEPVYSEVQWNASDTAIIICDMWIEHPCRLAGQRVDAMAPLFNQVISAARDHGVLIVHA